MASASRAGASNRSPASARAATTRTRQSLSPMAVTNGARMLPGRAAIADSAAARTSASVSPASAVSASVAAPAAGACSRHNALATP